MGKPQGLRRRLRITVLVAAALAVGGISVQGASAGDGVPLPICHRTGAQNNPYIVNTPNNSGQVEGHFNQHPGPVWTPGASDWGDIIPPQDGAPNGLNWNAAGQAIFFNGCVPPDLPPPPPPPPPPPDGITPGDPGTPGQASVPGAPSPPPARIVVAQPRTTG